MAGYWIKMRVDLNSDPAVIAIAARLGMDEFAIVGRLHHLWCWADAHTVDGNAGGVTCAWLDRYVSAPGFAAAMISVGWLVESDIGLSIPNFDRHNGETAKQRSLTAKRAARNRDQRKASRNAGCVTENAKSNADCVTKGAPRREEKREDEIEETTTEPNSAAARQSGLDSPSEEGAVVMEFPCTGTGPAKWFLTERKLAEYQVSFPAADVKSECRTARQWCIDNPKKSTSADRRTRVNRFQCQSAQTKSFCRRSPRALSAQES